MGMTLNCIHMLIFTGSLLYGCVMRPASQRFFIHSNIFLRIVIISYLATFLGTNSLSVLMCRKAVNQSILKIAVTFAFFQSQGTLPHSIDFLKMYIKGSLNTSEFSTSILGAIPSTPGFILDFNLRSLLSTMSLVISVLLSM